MQLPESIDGRPFTTHGHHLENGRLGAVVGVLGPSLPLRDPYILMLFGDGIVHILRKALAGQQHLPWRETALHDERLVDPDQVSHPGEREQVVADGDLTSGRKIAVDEQFVEQR